LEYKVIHTDRHLKSHPIKIIALACFICSLISQAVIADIPTTSESDVCTFVFISDVHFGLKRIKFRDAVNVPSSDVNHALLEVINTSTSYTTPNDNGVIANKKIPGVDFLVITGDLTNRQELYPVKIQSSALSWKEFDACYINGLKLKTSTGSPTALYLVPGNHDVSNAIGSPSKLLPTTDATSMTELYNRYMHPQKPVTPSTYQFKDNRIYYSTDIGGAHEIFITMWPDSTARKWIDNDLKHVAKDIPVFIFCHDPPAIDARHLTNPNGNHDINSTDKFENVVCDIYQDGKESDGETTLEQAQLTEFLRSHPNIVGYFHGHTNFTEFYTWKGTDNSLNLKTFRSDSPMKGQISGKDESKLAFQIVSFDIKKHQLTSRECLWNTKTAPGKIVWGKSITVSIAVPQL
jgi:3',5'-cyclic AMP phosphodiesterase CpdA